MRATAIRVAAALLIGGASVVGWSAPAQAAVTASVSPGTTGPGSFVTIRGVVDPAGCPSMPVAVMAGWSSGEQSIGSATTAANGAYELRARIPGEAPIGPFPITVFAYNCPNNASTTRWVTIVPPAPVVTKPSPPPGDGSPSPESSGSPSPSGSPDPSASPSGSASPSPTGTPSPTPPTGGAIVVVAPGDKPPAGKLAFDRSSVRPGDRLTAHGRGCTPNGRVRLDSDGHQVGETTADEAGGFAATIRFSTISPGRRTVEARCSVVLTGDIDLVVSSATGSNAATAMVLIFFVLAGAGVLRWQLRAIRRD